MTTPTRRTFECSCGYTIVDDRDYADAFDDLVSRHDEYHDDIESSS